MSSPNDFYDCSRDFNNGPDTLLAQCFIYIVRNLSTICLNNIETNLLELNPGISFPRELCEKLIQYYHRNCGKIDDRFVNLFSDTSVTSLQRVCLRDSNISDHGLKLILKHNLSDFDIEKCKNVTEKSLTLLNEYGGNMLCLAVSGIKLFPTFEAIADSVKREEQMVNPILNTPKLQRLSLRNIVFNQRDQTSFFNNLPCLTHLDLSGCMEIESLNFLKHLNNLVYLVLHNVTGIQEGLLFIKKLKSLRHLDISQSNDRLRVFQNENDTLAEIVKSLPNLVSLDISGTNLAGTGVAEVRNDNEEICDIPGLNSRMANKLQFLGLYGTQNRACRRHDIPANLISGDANEPQIIIAAKAYIDRPEVLQRVLNDLYHLFRYEHCFNFYGALSVVVNSMERHLSEKHIQISGSATLFYIVKNKELQPFSANVKRTVITTLLNGMNAHQDDDTMMRNGCLTLCQFKIPQDVLFEYERLVMMLLHIVSDMEQEGFVQRIGIYLLNSLACQVDNDQKQLLGDLNAMEKMLQLINDRVSRNMCDDVLEVAWSTMWNVTDETAINCERFLDGKGMEYFLKCLLRFPEKAELMRNMMGLLGNVAEVKHLRPRLMSAKYIEVFKQLLSSKQDGIEVSYNAAGVLSHLVSDGPECWIVLRPELNKRLPERHEVLQTMTSVIDAWDLKTERNINYRSFEPILQLARVRHTPQCQHWATWALANLTLVYPDKYCSLVELEGGIEIMHEIASDDAPYDRIKELALLVITHCEQFKRNSSLLEETPQLDG